MAAIALAPSGVEMMTGVFVAVAVEVAFTGCSVLPTEL